MQGNSHFDFYWNKQPAKAHFLQINFEITFKMSMPDISKDAQRHLLKMPSKRIFSNFQKKLLFTFIYLFLVVYYRNENQNSGEKDLHEKKQE